MWRSVVAPRYAATKVVVPASGPAPVGPYSPGVIADGYLYVSGQGAKTADGQMPATFEAQAQQTLDNVKAVVEAAGLTLDHVVYTHAYLEDISNSRRARPRLRALLPQGSARACVDRRGPPARHAGGDQRGRRSRSRWAEPRSGCRAGIRHLPFSPGMLTHDRLFISSLPGRDRERKHSGGPGRRGRRRARQLQGRERKPPA